MHISLFFSRFLPKGLQRLACQLLNCLFAANTQGINYSFIKILLPLFFTALGLKLTTLHIVGLLGKNQVEIKDNHGYVNKEHHRDVKKILMTEKVCKLYEEELIGKTGEGRKAIPTSKMPDLGWDIAETQLIQENQKENNSNLTPPYKH